MKAIILLGALLCPIPCMADAGKRIIPAQEESGIVVKEISITGAASDIIPNQALMETPGLAVYSVERDGKRLAAIIGPEGNIERKIVYLKEVGVLFLGIQMDRANFTIKAIRLKDSAIATVDLHPLDEELGKRLDAHKDAKPWGPFQLTSMKMSGGKLDCEASAPSGNIVIRFSISLTEAWPADGKVPMMIVRD